LPGSASRRLSSQGIAYAVSAQLGDVVGRIVLAIVAISIFAAALAAVQVIPAIPSGGSAAS
jgi:hypothetical protein